MVEPEPFKAAAGVPLEKTGHPPRSGIAGRIFQRGKAALGLLADARAFAEDLDRDFWDFALEIGTLHDGGLTQSDLRWLVCKGYLEQASEMLSGSGQERRFHKGGALTFTATSCFILTDAGARLLRQLSEASCGAAGSEPGSPSDCPVRLQVADASAMADELRPCWDRDRQELRLGRVVVKQFKAPAPNQEMVLAVFHEEGWPARIDDPLPPQPNVEPKRRLHDTINSLNRSQKAPLIRFFGDGTGQGVRWELVDGADRHGQG